MIRNLGQNVREHSVVWAGNSMQKRGGQGTIVTLVLSVTMTSEGISSTSYTYYM